MNEFTMLPGFSFHHIGYATRSIESTAAFFLQMGYVKGEVVYDGNQHVNIVLLTKSDSPVIELVETIDEKSPVDKQIKKNGVTPYHICYEVDDLSQAITALKKQRFVLLFKPVGAIAFAGREICYLYHKEVGLIEILQKQLV